MENVPQEATSGSLSSHPVLGNPKNYYKEKCQPNFAFWLAVLLTCTLGWRNSKQFYFWLSVCGLLYAFQSQADLIKSEKYYSFATTILIL